ncbi:MAG: hypothetical protein GY696_19400 [Gammaproteobacteria bacterium]|nr:hypothetical protein [Gammaproteobacteria bacterium]
MYNPGTPGPGRSATNVGLPGWQSDWIGEVEAILERERVPALMQGILSEYEGSEFRL